MESRSSESSPTDKCDKRGASGRDIGDDAAVADAKYCADAVPPIDKFRAATVECRRRSVYSAEFRSNALHPFSNVRPDDAERRRRRVSGARRRKRHLTSGGDNKDDCFERRSDSPYRRREN